MTLLPPELCAGHLCLVGLQFHSTKVWQERGKLTETETEFVLYRRKNNMLTRKLDKNNWNWNFVLKHVSKIISNIYVFEYDLFEDFRNFNGEDFCFAFSILEAPTVPDSGHQFPHSLRRQGCPKMKRENHDVIYYIYNILYIIHYI